MRRSEEAVLLSFIVAIIVFSCTACGQEYEYSLEAECLVDHSQNMCYSSPEEMQKAGFRPRRSKDLFKRKRKAAIENAQKEETLTKARQRYSDLQK